ncbi:mannose-1-phosphate guanylyltransferase/mannose-6-phosphate isomerase [soil metagenome]
MRNIRPLILCGGSGSRLWPLSRSMQPKQFQPMDGEGSSTFFQATVQRHCLGGFAEPWICVSQNHLATARRQLREIQCTARIVAEPVARNTGPAVLAAALAISAEDRDGVLVVLPADHVIRGDLNQRFAEVMPAVDDGLIVTFGVTPRYAETGYGYIVEDGRFDKYTHVHRVAEFVEKPGEARALELIASGRAFWASGISIFRADTIIDEYKRLDPETVAAVSAAMQNAHRAGAEIVLDATAFAQAHSDPTERVVFEKSTRMALAPAHIEWDDVGAWTSFHAIGIKTVDGNVTTGDVLMIDTNDSYVRGSDRLVAVVGMTDVIVVDTPDAVLVTTRQNSQKVKQVVERLVDMKRREVVDHSKWIMDWGQLIQLAHGSGFDLHLFNVKADAIVPFEPLADRRRLVTLGGSEATLEVDGIKHFLTGGHTVEIGVDQSAFLYNTSNTIVQLVAVTCQAGNSAPALPPMLENALKYGKSEYV